MRQMGQEWPARQSAREGLPQPLGNQALTVPLSDARGRGSDLAG